jgi:hypothetical protein
MECFYIMDNNKVKTVIENSKRKAKEIVNSSAKIRETYAVGRPNSARESSAEGGLKAFAIIISKFNPGYKLIKQ